MRTMLKIAVLFVLAGCALHAQAQRETVPVVDFEKNPETRYAVARPDGLIHPFHETWVRRFAESVSRRIRVLPA
jgi:hypothetical protein